jgi:hypothetical protein
VCVGRPGKRTVAAPIKKLEHAFRCSVCRARKKNVRVVVREEREKNDFSIVSFLNHLRCTVGDF